MEVNTRRVETPVPQEELAPAEIDPGFEKMRGKRMAQQMRVETDGHVGGFPRLLFQLAEVSLAQPEGQGKAVIYPAVGEQTLRDGVAEGRASGAPYRDKVHTVLQSSYSHH